MCWKPIRGPHDPARPVVCPDETSKQLISETRVPIAAKPGQVARYDYEYERNGTANLFMMFAPLEGWRHVKVTDRHAAVDYAQVLKELSDTHFPEAEKIILVQDNLSTHRPASLYEAFPAAEARRLVERFEWHYTPKHGSWLDMAESELGVLSSQCLDRRIPDKQTLIEEVAAWEARRNRHHTKADWQFTTTRRPRQTEAALPRTMKNARHQVCLRRLGEYRRGVAAATDVDRADPHGFQQRGAELELQPQHIDAERLQLRLETVVLLGGHQHGLAFLVADAQLFRRGRPRGTGAGNRSGQGGKQGTSRQHRSLVE